ncbi:ATP-dependent Clp protease ATP-binding subunit [Capnocytophaga sputigena]|uniref:ATP-dependent Clp protease ATP-binding subunit n=1 Tax=Capnocytophaga sputigena TaxID=1019 RepID=UPI00241C7978
MDFLNLDESVQSAIRIAKSIAREYGNKCFTPAHLLKALLHKEVGLGSFVVSLGKDALFLEEWAEIRMEEYERLAGVTEVDADEKIPKVFEEADNVRLKLGLLQINPICTLCALAKPEIGFSADQLKSFPIREKEILDFFLQGDHIPLQTLQQAEGQENTRTTSQPLTNLLKYCIDKTAQAREQNLSPIVGRNKETRQMLEILGRHSKPNVMIIGDSGVGKTAIIDGLVYDIINEKVPFFLSETTVWELDNGALIAGATYKGEIEDRLKNIIKELRQMDRVILFIDEIHTLLDPKQGNAGAANILKPELSKGNLTVIGATTTDEYRKLIEPDHAFSRRFEVLSIEEPTAENATAMLHFSLAKYKEFHKLDVSDEALSKCVTMAKRYVKDRRLPDSAIDLLDRTMSAVKMTNEAATTDHLSLLQQLKELEEKRIDLTDDDFLKELSEVWRDFSVGLSPIVKGFLNQDIKIDENTNSDTVWETLNTVASQLEAFAKNPIQKVEEEHLASVVAAKTNIPVGKIQEGEKEKLLQMEQLLQQRVVGQNHAIKSLTDAILESRSGMNKQGQPIGSFFFLGPTGTGKTELTKSLAEALFNDEKAMIRFDMSEFKEEHSAALLYGAPPGYVGYEEGGLLVNKIREQPYSVVLFDEIEKAHASVYDIFLQIMDEGKLHDRLGKEGDFSNAIIIFTSNVGSDWIAQEMSEGRYPSTIQMMEIMGRYFRPEFLARLSEIVPFSPIKEEMLLKIFDIQFKGFRKLLQAQNMDITLTDEAKKTLAFKGFTPKYGARQVAGTIRNYLRRPISRMILSGTLKKGHLLVGNLGEQEEIIWEVKEL